MYILISVLNHDYVERNSKKRQKFLNITTTIKLFLLKPNLSTNAIIFYKPDFKFTIIYSIIVLYQFFAL
jgi:hypothetical protein